MPAHTAGGRFLCCSLSSSLLDSSGWSWWVLSLVLFVCPSSVDEQILSPPLEGTSLETFEPIVEGAACQKARPQQSQQRRGEGVVLISCCLLLFGDLLLSVWKVGCWFPQLTCCHCHPVPSTSVRFLLPHFCVGMSTDLYDRLFCWERDKRNFVGAHLCQCTWNILYYYPHHASFNAQPLNPSKHVHQSILYMCINYFSLGAIAIGLRLSTSLSPIWAICNRSQLGSK